MANSNDEFQIDPRRLDEEILNQARATRAAGVRAADAKHAASQAKSKLDVTEARLRFQAKRFPDRFDLPDKPTVQDVAASVQMHKEYQSAEQELLKAKWEQDLADADVSAHIDRRKMIERYVELLQIDWRSEMEVKGSTPEVRGRVDEVRRRAVRGSPDDD